MARAARSEKPQPQGRDICDALEAELMHALMLRNQNPETLSCDFRVDIKPIGNRFQVSFNGLFHPPMELGEQEWRGHPLHALAEEEYEEAASACHTLARFMGSEEEPNPYCLSYDHPSETFTGTKDQFVAALNGFLATHNKGHIVNPVLTTTKER